MKEKEKPDHPEEKRKVTDQCTPTIVKNSDIADQWKLGDGEKWHMWRHKIGKGPTLSNGSKTCLKYHVR